MKNKKKTTKKAVSSRKGKYIKRKPRVKKKIRSLKAKKFKVINEPWGLANVWNKALEKAERREITERDYLWATDMSKSLVDVWLQLKGEKPSNEPNARSLRKFEAGDVFEWIVKLILMRAGLLRRAQLPVEYQYKGLMRMSGRIDYLAGGKPDTERIKKELEAMDLPEVFKRAGERIIAHIKRKYPEGLPEMPFEVKSIASFGADAMERTNRSIQSHRTQMKFYLNGSRYDKGMLIYICRDDLRMFEFLIQRSDKDVEKEIKKFCQDITEYWRRDEQPPNEEEIIFDWDAGKFNKNLKIEYSNYLKKLYGFKEPRKYSELVSPVVSRWNRVMSRIKHGERMTKNNQEAINEMEERGFNVKKIIKVFSNGENSEN